MWTTPRRLLGSRGGGTQPGTGGRRRRRRSAPLSNRSGCSLRPSDNQNRPSNNEMHTSSELSAIATASKPSSPTPPEYRHLRRYACSYLCRYRQRHRNTAITTFAATGAVPLAVSGSSPRTSTRTSPRPPHRPSIRADTATCGGLDMARHSTCVGLDTAGLPAAAPRSSQPGQGRRGAG